MYSLVNEDLNFSDWLIEQMNERGWSQADLARSSGLTRQAISNYVNAVRTAPDAEACVALARAFKLPPEHVLRVAGYLPPEPDQDRPPGLLEMIEIFRNATPEEQEEMIAYARWRVERAREERERAKKRRPGTAEG